MSSGIVISPRFDQRIDESARPFRLGLFGGTFDPIHYGHLHIAESARQQFNLDGVLFVPAGMPVQKVMTGFSDPRDRHAMLAASVADNLYFDVSRMEMERSGETYTIDTLRALKKRFADKIRIFFIAGSDDVADMGNWKDADEIMSLITVLCAQRSLSDQEGALDFQAPVGFDVRQIDSRLINISSRELRQWVRSERSIHYLVPLAADTYIMDQGLYRD